ncbi:MAG: TOBE domain-containing protein, partial [Mesorhizobium sp.]
EGFLFPSELVGQLNAANVGQDRLALGIRPEGVMVSREAADGYLPVEAHIIEPLGSYDIVDLKVGAQMLRARTRSGFVGKPGVQVFAKLDPAQAHFFDTTSGNSLGVRL